MNLQDLIVASIVAHPTLWILGLGYNFLAAVSAMPQPGSNKPVHLLVYEFLFDYLHTLMNQVGPIVARKAAEYQQTRIPMPIPPARPTSQIL